MNDLIEKSVKECIKCNKPGYWNVSYLVENHKFSYCHDHFLEVVSHLQPQNALCSVYINIQKMKEFLNAM